MNGFRWTSKPASLVWLEPHRLQAGGSSRPLTGLPTEDQLAQTLEKLPLGPTAWVVDDQLAPSLLLRDIVEVPSGHEAREAFFRWRFSQSLALESPYSVQGVALEEGLWLLSGIDQELRDHWLQAAVRSGRPIHTLVPRWLWLFNRLAPSLEIPGMLLSLCPAAEGGFTGTLVAWGQHLTLLRPWSEPASPTVWMTERVLPTAAYLHREARPPQRIFLWGASEWPQGDLPVQILLPEIPTQETC